MNPGYVAVGVAMALIIAACLVWLLTGPSDVDRGVVEYQVEAERFCGMLPDPTGTDEEVAEALGEFRTGGIVPPSVRVHIGCVDAWADGVSSGICPDCRAVLAVAS